MTPEKVCGVTCAGELVEKENGDKVCVVCGRTVEYVDIPHDWEPDTAAVSGQERYEAAWREKERLR